jgi:hypothetical protein
MNRSLTATVLWSCLAGMMGSALFLIKHEVKDLETRLTAVHREIEQRQEDIHVLNAEWSFLNDPVRLQDLAQRHLGMRAMAPTQMATLNTLNAVATLALAQAQQHQAPPMPTHGSTHEPTHEPTHVPTLTPHPAINLVQAAPSHQQPSDPLVAHRHIAGHIAGGSGLAMVSPGEAR